MKRDMDLARKIMKAVEDVNEHGTCISRVFCLYG
jgi:hypothetical protein